MLNDLLEHSLAFEYEDGGVTPIPRGHTTGWRVLPALLVAQGQHGRFCLETDDGARVIAGTNGAVLMPPGVRHRVEVVSPNGLTSRWCHITFTLLGTVNVFSLFQLPLTTDARVGAEFGELCAGMTRTPPVADPTALVHITHRQALGFHLLTSILQMSAASPSAATFLESAHRLTPVFTFLRDHLTEELTRPELAALVHLSPARFHALFLEAAGVAPMEYIKHLRLRKAQQLLRTGELAVSEVAAKSGYRDPFHFSRQFKAEFGVSPLAYRQSSHRWFPSDAEQRARQ